MKQSLNSLFDIYKILVLAISIILLLPLLDQQSGVIELLLDQCSKLFFSLIEVFVYLLV